jgi:hypothetical protein
MKKFIPYIHNSLLGLSAGRHAPEQAPALSQRLDENTIRRRRPEDPHRRISRTDRSEKDESDQKQREYQVGPGVERPLPGPQDGQTLRKRSQVRKRPNIVSAGPARPDNVAEEMKVNGKDPDGEQAEAFGGEERHDQWNGNGRQDTVEQSVVVLAVVPRTGTPEKTIGLVEQDTQSIGIRKNTAPGCQRPVPISEAKRVRQRPRSQKVRDGVHR